MFSSVPVSVDENNPQCQLGGFSSAFSTIEDTRIKKLTVGYSIQASQFQSDSYSSRSQSDRQSFGRLSIVFCPIPELA